MCVVFSHTNQGLPAFSWRLMKSLAAATNSSSQVSMRFLVSGPGVLDLLLADLAPARLHGRVVLVGGPGMDDAARTEVLAELGILRIVVHLRLFLGVQVIEVAEELVEAVVGGQHVVQVAQVVLAELPGGVALLLEQRRDGDDLLVHADRRGRNADLRQAGAIHALPGDERGAAGGAALLAVAVGEQHAFLGDAGRCSASGSPSGHACSS